MKKVLFIKYIQSLFTRKCAHFCCQRESGTFIWFKTLWEHRQNFLQPEVSEISRFSASRIPYFWSLWCSCSLVSLVSLHNWNMVWTGAAPFLELTFQLFVYTPQTLSTVSVRSSFGRWLRNRASSGAPWRIRGAARTIAGAFFALSFRLSIGLRVTRF